MKLRRRILWLLLATLASTPLFGERWYVRPDGGTRYSSKVTSGQCDGKTDAPCSGKGVNQHCVYSDFRYLLDEDRGGVGQGAWVIGGGDTVIVRGCKALSSQQHPSNPNCRVWRDMPTGNAPKRWCYGVGRMVASTHRFRQGRPRSIRASSARTTLPAIEAVRQTPSRTRQI